MPYYSVSRLLNCLPKKGMHQSIRWSSQLAFTRLLWFRPPACSHASFSLTAAPPLRTSLSYFLDADFLCHSLPEREPHNSLLCFCLPLHLSNFFYLMCTLSHTSNPRGIWTLLFRHSFRNMYWRIKCTNIIRIPKPPTYHDILHEKYAELAKSTIIHTLPCASVFYYISKCSLNLSPRMAGTSCIFSHSHSNSVCPLQAVSWTCPSNKEASPTTNFCSSPPLIHFAVKIPSKLLSSFYFFSLDYQTIGRYFCLYLAIIPENPTALSSSLFFSTHAHLIPAVQAEGFTRGSLFLCPDEMQTAQLRSGYLPQLLKLNPAVSVGSKLWKPQPIPPPLAQLCRAWRPLTSLATSFPFSMTQLKHQISIFCLEVCLFPNLSCQDRVGKGMVLLRCCHVIVSKCCYLNGNH